MRMWIAVALTGTALAGPGLPNPYAPTQPTVGSQVREVEPFQWTVEPPALRPDAPDHVALKLQVPPGYVVYRDQLEVQVAHTGGLVVGAPDFPPALEKVDPAVPDEKREVYDMDVVIHVPVAVGPETPPGMATMVVVARHQGCRDGLCFPPRTREIEVLVPVRSDGQEPGPK